MPRTNLNDILIFMAVVDAGSFVGGGQTMGLSRSAAGKAVIRLEDRLGARLLNRTTRSLSLTEEGRLFYERGLQILASVDEAEASVSGKSGAPRGVLRLTAPDAFGRLVVLPLLEKISPGLAGPAGRGELHRPPCRHRRGTLRPSDPDRRDPLGNRRAAWSRA